MTLPSPLQRQNRRYQLLQLINDETTLCGLIPSDVWSQIFIILTLPPIITFNDTVGDHSFKKLQDIAVERHKKYGDRDLRNVSRVCRTWREIAVRTAELWTHINLAFPEQWRNLKVARSKAAPMYISAGLEAKYAVHGFFFNRLLPPSAIVDIEVAVPPGSRARQAGIEMTLASLNYHKIDNIRDLTVFMGPSVPYDSPLPVISVQNALYTGVQSKNPNLRTLILHGCLLNDLDHPSFSNVTRLFVGQKLHPLLCPPSIAHWNQSTAYRNSLPSSDQWSRALKRMPQLTHLHLQGTVVPASQQPTSQVFLPHLIDLSLIDGHMGGGICELFHGISASQASSLYLSVSPTLDKKLDELLVEGIKRWFAHWPHPLPNPGTVGILSDDYNGRFLIHNSTNKSGLQFHIAHHAPAGGLFSTHAMQFIMPVINGVTDLKLMKGKSRDPLPVIFNSVDNWPFWNVKRLTLLERRGRWKRKRFEHRFKLHQSNSKQWLPYYSLQKTLPSGRSNLDFPYLQLFDSLQEIRYLPERLSMLQNSNHCAEILRFSRGFLGIDSKIRDHYHMHMGGVIIVQKAELGF